jgi:malate/lactate dehydrogenase
MGRENVRDSVAIVGVGAVGATTAYALMNAGAASEIILISRDRDKVAGEVMDLNHDSSFVPPVRIREGSYEDCKDALMVIVTAGVRQKPGESRMDLFSGHHILNVHGSQPSAIIRCNEELVGSAFDLRRRASFRRYRFPTTYTVDHSSFGQD